MDCEDQMPFDQHYLLACIAPRYVSVGGAVEDVWADPNSEYLACCAASEFYIAMGKPGFVGLDRLPEVGDDHIHQQLLPVWYFLKYVYFFYFLPFSIFLVAQR